MNNLNSVPGRIVIVGTSTKKLSDRFENINANNKIQEVQQFNNNKLTNNCINDSRRSFLYDDYMGNNMFEQNNLLNKNKISIRSKNIKSHVSLWNVYKTIYDRKKLNKSVKLFNSKKINCNFLNDRQTKKNNKINMFVTKSLLNSHHNLYISRKNMPKKLINYYKPVSNLNNEITNLPIQSRITFFPKRLTKKPFSQLINKSFRRFNNSVRNQKHGFNKTFFSRQNVKKSKNFNLQQQDERKKMTVEELDQELDKYMKSFKHPRVEV